MKTIGKIYPEKTLFLRVRCGDAEADGLKYEMCTHAGQGFPIVYSEQTGKYFTLDWNEIVNLAVKSGIDKPEKSK